MFLLITEGVTANLQQIAVLQHAVVHGLSRPEHQSRSMKHDSSTADVDHSVPRQYLRVFEEIDIRFLPAADIRLRLIKDELFPRERNGIPVQRCAPPVLLATEGAFLYD